MSIGNERFTPSHPQQTSTTIRSDSDRPTQPITVEARVEVADNALIARSDEIASRIRQKLRETIRLRVTVTVGEAGSVPRTEVGKAKRVFEQTGDQDPLA